MKEIIEIIISSINHLDPAHIISCVDNSMMFSGYKRKSIVRIRCFSKERGGYNKDGKFISIDQFNKSHKNRVQACYDELIEAQFNIEQ